MKGLKSILFAEDNEHDIELTLEALSEHNLMNEVITVRDGEEALNYLYKRGKYQDRQSSNPAVILLDLKMPKVDGLEVLRRIKGDDTLKTIPVVMLTTSREESDLLNSYHYGVNAYVVKPVDFQEFLSAVKQLGVFWAILNETPQDPKQGASDSKPVVR
ncbi:MAG: response regulator [Bacteroidota bacterium]|jgi:CheY-like chemotaxis protein